MTAAATSQPKRAANGTLVVRGVSKTFGGQRALDDVSVEFPARAVTGLVGQNGSGKSTLIKILAGVYTADAGELTLDGETVDLTAFSPQESRRRNMHFVHQDLALVPEMTIAENIGLANGFPLGRSRRLHWAQLREEARELLLPFGLDVDVRRPVGELTPGQRALIAIARAFGPEARGESRGTTLVLDEPTAALPEHEVEILFDAVRKARDRGARVIYVSHRLEEVFQTCDRLVILRDGKVVHSGRAADISKQELVTAIVGRNLKQVRATPREAPDASGPVALHAEAVSGKTIRDVDLTIRRGEVLGVAGLLGSGRSELGRLLAGAQPLESGAIWLEGERLAGHGSRSAIAKGIGYVPEDRRLHGAIEPMSVRENLTLASLGEFLSGPLLRHGRERRVARAQLDGLGVVPRETEIGLAALSGGNQQRVVMGKWLRLDPKVLILDEPTQGIDVGAKAEILELIRSRARDGLAVLMISSEFSELEAICSRVIVLHEGRISATLTGSEVTEGRISAACYEGSLEGVSS